VGPQLDPELLNSILLANNGYDGGDVQQPGVIAYAASQGLALRGFWYAVGDPEGQAPDENPNVNGEALSPLVDFFLCNGRPIMMKVANCVAGSACTRHFVVAKSKSTVAVEGRTVMNATMLIADPGYGDPITDLVRQFGPEQRTRRNRIYAVEPVSRVLAA